MSWPYSSKEIDQFLKRRGIAAEIVELPVEVHSVEAAARAMNVEPARIVKTVLFFVAGQPVLAIGNGPGRMDRSALALHFGVPFKLVRLAYREEVLAETGFEAGAVPPVGHVKPLTTVYDRGLRSHDVVYAGGGSNHTLLCIRVCDLLRCADAVEMDLMTSSLKDME
ncbi:MAG: YbaK/EbsC family protein [Anaerolineales bacterium]|nr:YbaK/EbsC family protein [Anaerolineales bacterium]